MSILTKNIILKEIKKGNIKITPYDPRNVGPGSIDLSLGKYFRLFKKGGKVFDADKTDYRDVTKFVEAESIVLRPGETILGVTKEKVTLAPNLCGWLEGRTRFARLGLLIHISASFMQPGVSNHQVLEISNMGGVPLRLTYGMKICQFVFQRTEGKAKYAGHFAAQDRP